MTRLVPSPTIITEASTAADGSRCKDDSQTLGREPKLEISSGYLPLELRNSAEEGEEEQ